MNQIIPFQNIEFPPDIAFIIVFIIVIIKEITFIISE